MTFRQAFILLLEVSVHTAGLCRVQLDQILWTFIADRDGSLRTLTYLHLLPPQYLKNTGS